MNEENLKKRVPFEPNDERINRDGRPKGSRNRTTIVKDWLETSYKFKNPITDIEEDILFVDQITIAQIDKARKGDTAAYKELMDAGYGKLVETAKIEHSGEINNPITLTDEQFKEALEALKPK